MCKIGTELFLKQTAPTRSSKNIHDWAPPTSRNDSFGPMHADTHAKRLLLLLVSAMMRDEGMPTEK